MHEKMTLDEIEQALRDMPEVAPPSDDEIDAMERELGLPSWRREGRADVADVLMAVGL